MKRFTLMVSFLTLLCLNIVAQNFELYENKQIFSNYCCPVKVFLRG